mgnify:CR=1 FL=1
MEEHPLSSDSAPLRLAVFDVDGTLIDSQKSIVGAMAEAWRALGMEPPTHEAVLRIVGLPLLEGIGLLAAGHPPERHAALREQYSSSWTRMRAEGLLCEDTFPGAFEALDALEEQGWLLGVATGKSRRGLDSLLDKYDLASRFVTLQTSDNHRGKPHPEMLEHAIAEAGTDPASTVMIGDTTFDIEMGRNAGTFAIGVEWGYHSTEELWKAGAHAVIKDFAELPRTIANLTEGGRP